METTKKTAQLQYIAIEIVERAMVLPESLTEAPANFNFNITVNVQVNELESLIIPRVSIIVSNKEDGADLGKIVVNNVIKMPNLHEFLVESDGKNGVQQGLIKKLSETAISTTRGVMWDSFRGTFLHGAILPVIDTDQGEFSKK